MRSAPSVHALRGNDKVRTVAARRVSGYADVRDQYESAGWTPLPLPRGQKGPPPKGYTGRNRHDPKYNYKKQAQWRSTYPDGNVAIVMPPGVIGIDVDAYHGGSDTFGNLADKYGPVPGAPYSTSRDDGSGIHFYRVPDGTELVGKINGGIEIIQPFHRYAVVWPSIHPEGRMYRWHGSPGIPVVADLPDLPDAWLAGLASHNKARAGHGYDGSADEWFDSLPDGILPLGYRIQVRAAIKRFTTQGGRYDAMTTMVARLVGGGAYGLPVRDAIDDLFRAYVNAVDGERDGEGEFDRAFNGAISKFGGR